MPRMLFSSSARTVATLSVAQIIAWGTTYEMIAVYGRVMAPDLGVPNEVTYLGLSIMMLINGLAGPKAGRLIQRHGARTLLIWSSLLFAAGLVMLSAAQETILYFVAWCLLGLGAAAGLASPAFAAVVEREGAAGSRAITLLMIFTALSPTISWPLLALGNEVIGWRWTLFICALIQLFVCVPLYYFGLTRVVTMAAPTGGPQIVAPELTAREKRRAFGLLAGSTSLNTFMTFGLGPSLLAVLQYFGASPAFAVQLGSARGIMGSVARIVEVLIGRRSDPLLLAGLGCYAVMGGLLILLLAPSGSATLIGFIALYGLGIGILALSRALLPLAVFSPKEYGLQAGRLTLPQNIGNAIAPVVFTAIIDRIGVSASVAFAALLAFLSLVLMLMLIRLIKAARARAAIPSPPSGEAP